MQVAIPEYTTFTVDLTNLKESSEKFKDIESDKVEISCHPALTGCTGGFGFSYSFLLSDLLTGVK